jgi:hypothetical protein
MDYAKEQYGEHIIDIITEKYIPNLKKIILREAYALQ